MRSAPIHVAPIVTATFTALVALAGCTVGPDYTKPRIPCDNVVIENCVVRRAHSGVAIWAEVLGGMSNVTVTNCVFDGTRFLLIISKVATLFAPFRVFLPVSGFFFALSLRNWIALVASLRR